MEAVTTPFPARRTPDGDGVFDGCATTLPMALEGHPSVSRVQGSALLGVSSNAWHPGDPVRVLVPMVPMVPPPGSITLAARGLAALSLAARRKTR